MTNCETQTVVKNGCVEIFVCFFLVNSYVRYTTDSRTLIRYQLKCKSKYGRTANFLLLFAFPCPLVPSHFILPIIRNHKNVAEIF